MIRAYFLNHTDDDVTLLSKLYTEVCLFCFVLVGEGGFCSKITLVINILGYLLLFVKIKP